MKNAIHKSTIDDLKNLVGRGGWIDVKEDMDSYLSEQRGLYKSYTPLVLRPNSTETVSKILSYCHKRQVPIVPQGGNTGLVGGTVTGIEQNEILLNLERMQQVRKLSIPDSTIIVESGLTLSAVQQIAESSDRLFPLSLASEGSCQIGGNLATNAGGVNVLRYGNARDLVLGLEVVLPDGSVWNGLKMLRKDNTGYNLKHLFLGSEGTLGIITAAALKLFPPLNDTTTAIAAVQDINSALDLLNRLQQSCGNTISAYELISKFAFDLVLKYIPNIKNPFNRRYQWYVLLDAAASNKNVSLRTTVERILHEAIEEGTVFEATTAVNNSQAIALWKIRETIPEAQKPEGASIKHDIAVPISLTATFIKDATAAVLRNIPGARPCIFGHLGDGNIHFNITSPENMPETQFLDQTEHINKLVFDISHELGGSISAEHGIGHLKREKIHQYKDAAEINLMRSIKQAIDPKGILNPGKVVKI